MTEQCYYIGIDMDDRNAVISYYKAGMREPETLSTIAGSEIYQIPVALIKKRGLGSGLSVRRQKRWHCSRMKM